MNMKYAIPLALILFILLVMMGCAHNAPAEREKFPTPPSNLMQPPIKLIPLPDLDKVKK